eukprot:1409464-Pyramimonas_sp.AAC.1
MPSGLKPASFSTGRKLWRPPLPSRTVLVPVWPMAAIFPGIGAAPLGFSAPRAKELIPRPPLAPM